MFDLNLDFKKELDDQIYGTIPITQIEEKIIKTPVFYRLKAINQLGIAKYVFPAANHSRYQHSIGTMHMASLMLSYLFFNSEPPLPIDKTIAQHVRLAALLHDIGHGPFSHNIEEVLNYDEAWIPEFGGQKFRTHEDFSLYHIKTNSKLSAIFRDHEIESNILIETLSKPSGFPFYNVISGDIDADRIDFLIRDSYNLSKTYGVFEWRKLLQQLTVEKHPDLDDRLFLMLKAEGVAEGEALLMARYFHYLAIPNNPALKISEDLFVRYIIRALQKKAQEGADVSQLLFRIFTEYTDDQFLYTLRGIIPHDSVFETLRNQNFAYESCMLGIAEPQLRYQLYKISKDTQLCRAFEEEIRQITGDPDIYLVFNILKGIPKE